VANLLKPFVNEWKEQEQSLDPVFRGVVKDKWALYENPLQPEGKVLMGFKDKRNHYFSGYFYCPFYPFTMSPPAWNEEMHQHGILYSRYGKKLIDANFYGVIDISDLPTPKTEEAPVEESKAESEA
jgi:hypothetical protein